MPVDPARRPRRYPSDETFRRPRSRSGAVDRRRRQRHLRLLRRDLLVDGVTAVLLTVLTLSVTAGLGAVTLAAIPVAGLVIGSFVVERARRRRRRQAVHLVPASRR